MGSKNIVCIRTMLPADGWQAVYFDSQTGKPRFSPLLLWVAATIAGDAYSTKPEERVVGFRQVDGREPTWAEKEVSFVGYASPNETQSDWESKCMDAYTDRKEDVRKHREEMKGGE